MQQKTRDPPQPRPAKGLCATVLYYLLTLDSFSAPLVSCGQLVWSISIEEAVSITVKPMCLVPVCQLPLHGLARAEWLANHVRWDTSSQRCRDSDCSPSRLAFELRQSFLSLDWAGMKVHDPHNKDHERGRQHPRCSSCPLLHLVHTT